jgi:hypothetical protein
LLPGVQVHRGEFADARALDEQIERLALIDVRAARRRQIDQRFLRQFPYRAVAGTQRLRDLVDVGDRAFGVRDALANRFGPHAELLEVVHEVLIDLQEFARERLTLEEIAHLRFDALVAAAD